MTSMEIKNQCVDMILNYCDNDISKAKDLLKELQIELMCREMMDKNKKFLASISKEAPDTTEWSDQLRQLISSIDLNKLKLSAQRFTAKESECRFLLNTLNQKDGFMIFKNE